MDAMNRAKEWGLRDWAKLPFDQPIQEHLVAYLYSQEVIVGSKRILRVELCKVQAGQPARAGSHRVAEGEARLGHVSQMNRQNIFLERNDVYVANVYVF